MPPNESEVKKMLDKTIVKDYVSVLFSNAESLENVSDDMANIKMLTQESRNATAKTLRNAITQAESVTEPSDINFEILTIVSRHVLAFIDALNISFEIFERSITAVKSASEEVGAIADSLDTMATAPENQTYSNNDD